MCEEKEKNRGRMRWNRIKRRTELFGEWKKIKREKERGRMWREELMG